MLDILEILDTTNLKSVMVTFFWLKVWLSRNQFQPFCLSFAENPSTLLTSKNGRKVTKVAYESLLLGYCFRTFIDKIIFKGLE